MSTNLEQVIIFQAEKKKWRVQRGALMGDVLD